jgi:hypothetical protein
MKHARKSGLQMVLINLPRERLSPEMLAHRRNIAWPQVALTAQAAAAS